MFDQQSKSPAYLIDGVFNVMVVFFGFAFAVITIIQFFVYFTPFVLGSISSTIYTIGKRTVYFASIDLGSIDKNIFVDPSNLCRQRYDELSRSREVYWHLYQAINSWDIEAIRVDNTINTENKQYHCIARVDKYNIK